MSNLVLYRKYRPKEWDEVIGQEHVTRTLTNAIKLGRVSHAYLFSGPRGTGKTTIARLLAKSLGCADLDLIEIDAASNRGIDEIRQLREGIKFAPTVGKYKVFIIDEVHQLTKEAFNALLKTLEEPPAHAVFVLATTEIHKVPQTIISRCQRFDFKRISVKDIISRLKFIAKEEKIAISDEALNLIAEASEGGFRDAISYLDQISAYKEGEISIDDVVSILGMTDYKTLSAFVTNISENKYKEAIILLNELAENGYDMEQLTKNLIEFLRKLLLIKTIGTEG